MGKYMIPKNIDEDFKVLQRKLRREALFVQYDKNKNVKLLSEPLKTKPLLDVTKVLCSLIAPSIKEGDYYDASNFFARHYGNGSSHIQYIDFGQSYIPVERSDSFIVNISIAAKYRLTAMVLNFGNDIKIKMFPFTK